MTGAEVKRVCLRYDAGLTQPDTWRLIDSCVEIRVRINRLECSSKIELRWRVRDSTKWPDAVFTYPVDADGTLWLTAPARLGGGMLLRELQLERAPGHVAAVMMTW